MEARDSQIHLISLVLSKPQQQKIVPNFGPRKTALGRFFNILEKGQLCMNAPIIRIKRVKTQKSNVFSSNSMVLSHSRLQLLKKCSVKAPRYLK